MKSKSITGDIPVTESAIVRLRERPVYENRFLTLYDDEVRFPQGKLGNYLRLGWKCQYCVGIVPVTEKGEVLLIRQFCYARNQWVQQIPKGMGDPGQEPIESARRELREELGATAESLEFLSTLYVDAGLIENPLHLFLARGVQLNRPTAHEATELISEPVIRPLAECISPTFLVALEDPITISALVLAAQKLGKLG